MLPSQLKPLWEDGVFGVLQGAFMLSTPLVPLLETGTIPTSEPRSFASERGTWPSFESQHSRPPKAPSSFSCCFESLQRGLK